MRVTLKKKTKRKQAFITPKSGKGKELTLKNIDKFKFTPNLNKGKKFTSRINEKTKNSKVGVLVSNKILDEFKGVKNIKVKVVDEMRADGSYNITTNVITIKRGSKAAMDKALNHEIQHALDSKTKTNRPKKFFKDQSKKHDNRKVEQTTKTNELLLQAEKLRQKKKTPEQISADIVNYLERTN